ncbi:MAG: hypothetical protein Q8M03_04190, partial [Legionella sp.]|nr:hypothetical protein [Legionella sp.]
QQLSCAAWGADEQEPFAQPSGAASVLGAGGEQGAPQQASDWTSGRVSGFMALLKTLEPLESQAAF